MLVSVLIQPNVTAAARNAFSRPVPARAHSAGVKIAEIIEMKRLKRLPWGPASVAEPSPPAPNFEILPISANTSGTSLPMTTWY